MPIKLKKQEYELFSKLSKEWWDEKGKFKVLHQIRPIRMQYILKQLHGVNIEKLEILDIGCGGGLISESLSKLGANVTGIDFVKDNIEIAKQHAKKNNLNIKYLHSDIENFSTNKKYDVIILFEILEHLTDWKKSLLKVSKILKNKGLIILSTINRNIFSKYGIIFLAENFFKIIPKGTHSYDKFIKPKEIELFMKKIEFTCRDTKGLIFDPTVYDWKLSDNTILNFFSTYSKIN